jgi:Pvc16 N-terminal domain
MGLVVAMLADLDETLRTLLKRELERHGFDGVEIAFDAPAREWSGQLSSPTVNLFLYDLRESQESRPVEWRAERGNGRAREVRPPMIMECSYAVTAWTQAVEDEHRLLSQVLAVLFAYPTLPDDVLHGRLGAAAQLHPIGGKIAQAKADGKADFWNAVGGQYKASLDYVVSLSCESGTAYERGPEVRTQSTATRLVEGPASTVLEMHRFGGTVAAPDGSPLADVWVTLPGLGLFTASDRQGRFLLDRVPPGRHRLVARARDGGEADEQIDVPGSRTDLIIGPRARSGKGK